MIFAVLRTKAGKLPPNVVEQLSAKDAEENFQHAAINVAFHNLSLQPLLKKLTARLLKVLTDACDKILNLEKRDSEVA
jgi:hypothetical protein